PPAEKPADQRRHADRHLDRDPRSAEEPRRRDQQAGADRPRRAGSAQAAPGDPAVALGQAPPGRRQAPPRRDQAQPHEPRRLTARLQRISQRPRARWMTGGRLRLACASPDVVTSWGRRMRALAAMIALLAACGDNLAGPVSVDDYPAAVREAVCRQLTRCGDVESFDTCMTTQIRLTIAFSASELAAMRTGKIAYSGASARVCVDGIAGASCD